MAGLKIYGWQTKGHMMKKLFNDILNGVLLIFMLYMLFIQPNLNSATPLRDISKALIEHFLPIFFTVVLVFYCELKLIRHYQKQNPEPFSINWNETVPDKITRFILLNIFIIIIGIMIGLFGFSWIFKQLSTMIFS